MLKKMLLIYLIFLISIVISTEFVSADMARVADQIADNLSVSVSDIVLIITVGGLIVMVAFDARVALLVAFIMFTGEFILFYEATLLGYEGWDPYKVGVAMMVCVVILALMLLVTYKKANTPQGTFIT